MIELSIAAVNGRAAVVVSGEVAVLEELIDFCADLDLRTRRIDVDYASHSAEVEAIRAELISVLRGIEPRSSRTAFFSTVTGTRLDTGGLDADYWYRNIRQTVLFDQAVRSAAEHGYRTFIESSPHPALIAGIEDTVNDCADGDAQPINQAIVIPTLGRDDGGLERFLMSAATRRSSRVWASIGARCCPAPDSSSCRRTPLSDTGFGSPVTVLQPTQPGWGRGPATMRCWARWWSCRPRAGWC